MANSNTNDVVFSGSCSSPAKKNAYPYKGIRMRKWGKWVAEVREPNKRTRIWLGSYHTPIAAARAYDTATYYLRGPTARINFPEFLRFDSEPDRLSADSIRKIATEVGARVDAEIRGVRVHEERSYVRYLFVANFDLNKEPEPEPETETEPEE